MKTSVYELLEPLENGEETLKKITLREPKAGEMRGLKSVKVLESDSNSLNVLLERITTPILTKQQIESLCFTDLINLHMEIISFFQLRDSQIAIPEP